MPVGMNGRACRCFKTPALWAMACATERCPAKRPACGRLADSEENAAFARRPTYPLAGKCEDISATSDDGSLVMKTNTRVPPGGSRAMGPALLG